MTAKDNEAEILALLEQGWPQSDVAKKFGVARQRVHELKKVVTRRAEESPFAGLRTRSRNCLKNAGIKTVEQLARFSERELLETPNFGKTSLAEIKDLLNANGLLLRDNEIGREAPRWEEFRKGALVRVKADHGLRLSLIEWLSL